MSRAIPSDCSAIRSYVVRCGDPGLARALVGAEMMRWLEGLGEPWGFELDGSLALVYGPPSVGLEEPLERLETFAELVRAAGRPDADASEATGLGERGRPS